MHEFNIEETLKSIFDSKDVLWKPSDKIPLLTKEIECLKSNVVEYINNSNYDIASILAESQELCAESGSLGEKLRSCKKEIENETMTEVTQSIESHGKISRELQSVEFALNIVNDVIQCGKFVSDFDEGREAQSFTKAVQAVDDLLKYIKTPSEGLTSLELYANTKNTAQLILDNLFHDLFQEWDRMVKWTVKTYTKRTIITMTLNVDGSLAVIDVFCALDRSKKIDDKVKALAQFILKDILTPIMNNECNIHVETEELMTLTINYKLNFKPSFETVLSQIKMFFNYLSNKFDVEFNKDKTIMKMIGREICDDFRDILIKDCLVETVPNNINDLQSYGKITSQIQEFQQFLTFKKFFPNEEYSILEYVKDIDIIFADRSSQYFLETARSIMLKDLSLTMSIGVEKIPEESTGEEVAKEEEEEALQIFDSTIPNSLFYFPRCMISKSAQELLDLVYVMMEQAVQCSDVVCKKLFNTTRLVFELYDAVVPYHHENYLQTIPQYVALFHNNCMYLAHNLLTLGDKWLILMEGRDVDYPIGFLDLVQKIRDLGYKYLTIHMQQQRKQILDNIRSSDLNCIVVKDVLGENAEAAVRQCLRQLQLLKNVWIGVFPTNVFTRLMATLVNMFVDELIHRVCTVEDISMEMATQLTEMYTLVVQKAPQLFLAQSDVEEHVKSWTKLQELIFVLKGSLKDIENHWNDGTGPLAIHFKTDELRSLVKALFQNTQIRANMLSKIK